MENGIGGTCSKFDCKRIATHVLVIEEGPQGEGRFNRCEKCAKFDLKMIPLVYGDCKLFVLPKRGVVA